MLNRSNRSISLILSSLCLGSWLFAADTRAQNNPEVGDVQHNPPPPAPEPVTPVRHAGPFERTVATTGTDHASVVGHFGVGTFGVLTLPVAGLTGGGGTFDPNGTLSAPTIGARYWLNEGLALEGALGIGISSGGTTVQTGTMSVETNDPHLFGLALHAGLPLVFATSQHFAFELVPELNFGFVTGGRDLPNNNADLSGVLLQVGARVGAEIQFGFIDIPQLSLQGTVGLHMSYEGRSASVGNVETSSHRFSFGTTVQGEPWDIFTGNIAAIYYF